MAVVLKRGELEAFDVHGVVCVRGAFDRVLADACVNELWDALPCDRRDRATWTSPVVRLWSFDTAAFLAAANSTRLVAAIDQLLGV